MFWKSLGTAGLRTASRAPGGFLGAMAIGGASIGALGGLFSPDRSIIGGAISGAGWGVGLFGAGVGAARLYGRYGRHIPGLASAAWGRASAFGRRITQAINPMRGIHI
jgi:hypothetical protein